MVNLLMLIYGSYLNKRLKDSGYDLASTAKLPFENKTSEVAFLNRVNQRLKHKKLSFQSG